MARKNRSIDTDYLDTGAWAQSVLELVEVAAGRQKIAQRNDSWSARSKCGGQLRNAQRMALDTKNRIWKNRCRVLVKTIGEFIAELRGRQKSNIILNVDPGYFQLINERLALVRYRLDGLASQNPVQRGQYPIEFLGLEASKRTVRVPPGTAIGPYQKRVGRRRR